MKNACNFQISLDIKQEESTGICVCLYKEDKRSLHAFIGAAQNYNVSSLLTDQWKESIAKYNPSNEVTIFYIEGFFIPGREDVMKIILSKFVNQNEIIENDKPKIEEKTKVTKEVFKLDEIMNAKKIKDIVNEVMIDKEMEKVPPIEAKNETEPSMSNETNKDGKGNIETSESSKTNVIEEETNEDLKKENEEVVINTSETENIPLEKNEREIPLEDQIPPYTGVKNLFATNLNAAYIVKEFSETVKMLVESADIIFGNREEFEALASIYDDCQTIQDVVQLLMRKEADLDRLKIFIITDGTDPVMVYYGTDNDFRWNRYCVPSMPSERVVDTTGKIKTFFLLIF